MRSAAEFVLPVLWDVEGRGSHDWLLIVVPSTVPGESLGAAGRLVARVADRFGRAQAAATAARKLEALVGGVGAHLGARMEIEMKGCPPCESAHESMILVLGLLLARVAEDLAWIAFIMRDPSPSTIMHLSCVIPLIMHLPCLDSIYHA